MARFDDFDLLPTLLATLAEQGLVTLTEIQERALPVLLGGRSIVGVAETGSGKTLAYALPILHTLKRLELDGAPVTAPGRPRAAVIVPTRELGEQVSKVFKPFTHTTRLRVRTVLGGTTLEVAKRNIAGPFEVLVATPGRVVKLIDRGLVDLADVRLLVFDEADQMLDQGFLPDATRIAAACPALRPMALFSATIPAVLERMIRELFAGAEVVRTQGSHRVVPSLTTVNRKVIGGKRFPLLAQLLAEPFDGGTLLFVNTHAQCDQVAADLRKAAHACAVYRGEMDKTERRANLKAFRDGTSTLLVSTDLGSRGLDLETVGRVINYHLPQQVENYLHRVGRTARAGRPGVVINFVTDRDRPLLDQLARQLPAPAPTRAAKVNQTFGRRLGTTTVVR